MIKSFQDIPSVNTFVERLRISFPEIQEDFIVSVVREELQELRNDLKNGAPGIEEDELQQAIADKLTERTRKLSLKKLVNATGVVLHTGLGRAPLSPALFRRLGEIAGYSSLEFNINSGTRGERNEHVSPLINHLFQSPASLVVNNNASAVMLALSALAENGEVIVSRSQLVEIGGSFRVPDVMARSGAVMIEVGTTNRTHLRDFEAAVSPRTKAILLAHSSNYSIRGFTAFPKLEEIVELAEKKGLFVIYDMGSGSPLQGQENIVSKINEQSIRDALAAGCHIVSFSGDKMLGGPQSGLICGRGDPVALCHRHSLYRALRCDKLILAALQLTLQEYLNNNMDIPVLLLLRRDRQQLQQLYNNILKHIPEKLHPQLELIPSSGESGSGTAPGDELPSMAISFPHISQQKPLAEAFRSEDIIPVIGYINKNHFYLDLKAVFDSDIQLLAKKIEMIIEKFGEI